MQSLFEFLAICHVEFSKMEYFSADKWANLNIDAQRTRESNLGSGMFWLYITDAKSVKCKPVLGLRGH